MQFKNFGHKLPSGLYLACPQSFQPTSQSVHKRNQEADKNLLQMIDVFGSSNGRNRYFVFLFCQIFNCRFGLKSHNVLRINANINCTSGINLESPSLIRRSRKVWEPPKKWSNSAY